MRLHVKKKVGWQQRFGEKIALTIITASIQQKVPLQLRFNTFGNNPHSQPMSHLNNRFA